jgi:hypothetical protein
MPQQRRIIWFALVMSVVIYVLMAWMTAQENAKQPFDDAVRQPLTLPLYGIAVVMFIIATVASKAMKQAGWIAGLALYESCAVFTLVAAFIAKDWRLILPGAALALIGMMRLFPSET